MIGFTAFLTRVSQKICSRETPRGVTRLKKQMTMTIKTMKRLLGAVALGLVVAGGNIVAGASVRLPAEQIKSLPSLAPLLSQITAAVVRFSITGRAGGKKNPRKVWGRPPNTRNLPPVKKKAAGPGVIT